MLQSELPIEETPISWGELADLYTELEQATSEEGVLKDQHKQAKARKESAQKAVGAAARRVRLSHEQERNRRIFGGLAQRDYRVDDESGEVLES